MLGLEKDIYSGVINTKEPRHYGLCFRREWQHMDVTSQDALDNYLDVTVNEAGNRTANLEARERLHTLAGQVGYY